MSTPQQQINYGNTANDGQGDALRNAFIKTDDNFDAIWNAGPVGSNITITNNSLAVNNTNGNVRIAANGIGVIETSSSLVPRLTNSYDLGSANLRYRSAYIGSGGLTVAGNLTVSGSYVLDDLRVNSISSDDSSLVTVQDGLSVRGLIDTESIYTDNYFYANGEPFVSGNYSNTDVRLFLASGFGPVNSNTIVTQGNVVVTGAVDTANIQNEFPINITTTGSETWQFAGNILRGPEGGSWQDAADTIYLRSPANGYVTLESVQNGNLVSELFMEHSFIRFRVDNGVPAKSWQMNLDGSFDVPGDIIPESNGTASLGNATNYWSNLWVANNTIYIGGVPLGVTGNVLTVNGEPVLSNDSDSSITTTGNLAAGNIAAGNISVTGIVSVTGNVTGANLITTGNVVGNVSGFAIGYRDIPQVAFTGNATIAAADAGKHFYSTESTDYVLTIADNSAVSWPVGTAITVVNRGTGNITMSQASGVSLYLAGNNTAGNRTVSTYGMATLLNVAANVWMINGTGVS